MKNGLGLLSILLLAAVAAAQNAPAQPAIPPPDPLPQPTETDLPASGGNVSTVPVPAVAPTTAPVPLASASVPAGTALMVRLETTLATFSNRPGDPFHGRITQPVVINGQTVIPVGATVEGRVTKVSEPRRISGRPTIGILPEAVVLPDGERLFLDATLTDTNIRGTDVNQEGQFKGESHDRRDTLETGGGTAGGMVIGGLVGGPVGVLVGGAVGAGSTTAHWLIKHRSAILPAGTQLTLELNRPVNVNASTAATPVPAPNGGSQ